MSWSSPLTWPITLREGRRLETLSDAATVLVGLSEDRQSHAWVEHAADLLLKAAKSDYDPELIEDATRQVERALKREGML
jgi:hypothetical protein